MFHHPWVSHLALRFPLGLRLRAGGRLAFGRPRVLRLSLGDRDPPEQSEDCQHTYDFPLGRKPPAAIVAAAEQQEPERATNRGRPLSDGRMPGVSAATR